MFTQTTKQGYPIIESYKKGDACFVIVKRAYDYAWGAYYDESDGVWAHGHYDYLDLKKARKDLLNMYFKD